MEIYYTNAEVSRHSLVIPTIIARTGVTRTWREIERNCTVDVKSSPLIVRRIPSLRNTAENVISNPGYVLLQRALLPWIRFTSMLLLCYFRWLLRGIIVGNYEHYEYP